MKEISADIEKIIRSQKVLIELGRHLTQIQDISQLLREIARRTSDIMEAERSSVFLYDKEKDELWSVVAEGERQIRFPADSGIGGYVLRTGEIVNEDDVYNNPLFNREIDRKTGYRTKSMLCVPLYDHNHDVIGVYQVLNKKGGVFESEDVRLLMAVAGQVSVILQNVILMENRKRMFESLIDALAESIDMRDKLTSGHSRRVMHYSVKIAKKLGLSTNEIRIIKYASYLHDYGKIVLKDSLLLKPGPLSDDEYVQIKKHVDFTRKILERIEFEEDLIDVPRIACLHHERLDGSGYPMGLKGDDIPLGARIIAVGDVFDALTNKRHYRRRWSVKRAFGYLKKEAGKKFDSDVVEALGEVLKDDGVLE